MKIEVKDLAKKYDAIELFTNFQFAIESGEMVGIFGKSGSGKTTLLNMLGLIETQYDGEIRYNEQLITKMTQRRNLLREKIGFIFQNYGLVDNETIYDNLNLVRKIFYQKKKAKLPLMINALQQVSLDQSFLDKKVFTCSGDEQQRVAIAKLFLKEASVIFADEPTASLDNDNKHNVLQHLKKLQQLGKTIVIVTHDQDISSYCDRIVTI